MAAPKHNVCLIDDDKIYQFTARKIIEATGIAKNILSFFNGKEAIEKVRYRQHNRCGFACLQYKLIFLDISGEFTYFLCL